MAGHRRTPPVKDVGEPCAGKSHARFDGGRLETEPAGSPRQSPTQPPPYDVDTLLRRRRGGRPPLGSAAATVESVRLDPELKRALLLRAAQEHVSVSEVIRRAIGEYLQAN